MSRQTCVPAAMFTPSQLSDEEDEECIEESSNAIYERQMLCKKHVFFFYSFDRGTRCRPVIRLTKGTTLTGPPLSSVTS